MRPNCSHLFPSLIMKQFCPVTPAIMLHFSKTGERNELHQSSIQGTSGNLSTKLLKLLSPADTQFKPFLTQLHPAPPATLCLTWSSVGVSPLLSPPSPFLAFTKHIYCRWNEISPSEQSGWWSVRSGLVVCYFWIRNYSNFSTLKPQITVSHHA